MIKFGVTERGDAGLHYEEWVKNYEKFQCDAVKLITKAPQLLLDKKLPETSIIECTITGYGGTALEPGVAPAEETLKAYEKLLLKYGPERVVLRVDPIIPYGEFLERSIEIVQECLGRIRISFLDLYPHVKTRFFNDGVILKWKTFHAPLEMRRDVFDMISTMYPGETVEVCAEPDLPCSGCISKRDVYAVGLDINDFSNKISLQRPLCCCVGEKIELLNRRTPCSHKCLYCYWKD